MEADDKKLLYISIIILIGTIYFNLENSSNRIQIAEQYKILSRCKFYQ